MVEGLSFILEKTIVKVKSKPGKDWFVKVMLEPSKGIFIVDSKLFGEPKERT